MKRAHVTEATSLQSQSNFVTDSRKPGLDNMKNLNTSNKQEENCQQISPT